MQINRVIAWFCGGLLAGALAALLTTSGCSKKVQPPDAASQLGVASWYGHPFDGRLTANGETYDMKTPRQPKKTANLRKKNWKMPANIVESWP